jgi:hypothetical protein
MRAVEEEGLESRIEGGTEEDLGSEGVNGSGEEIVGDGRRRHVKTL